MLSSHIEDGMNPFAGSDLIKEVTRLRRKRYQGEKFRDQEGSQAFMRKL